MALAARWNMETAHSSLFSTLDGRGTATYAFCVSAVWLLWFNPSKPHAAAQPLPHQWDYSENWRWKSLWTSGMRKRHLNRESKSSVWKQRKKEKTINSLLLMVRQVFSQIQESRAPLLLEKTNAITLNVPPFHVLPPILYTDVDVITSGISLLAVCVPAVSPPSFSCSPRFLGSVAVQKEEKPLVLHESCPGIIKTSLYCHLCVQHKSKT